jgi:hypothetical protein
LHDEKNISFNKFFMKKVVILLFAASALLSFSCNKYCNCKHYINGTLDKDYNKGRFVKESNLDCAAYSTPKVQQEDGNFYELKCK